MPTVYVDAPFRSVIRERKEELEREIRDHPTDEVYVTESEALESLLQDDATQQLEIKREQRNK